MKKTAYIIGIVCYSLALFNCSGGKEEESSTNDTPTKELPTVVVHEGYENLGDLTKSVIESIKKKDYESYITHVMSREEELAQSKRIENDSIRTAFVNEFSFSLHEEEEYFSNMIKYLNDSEINLDRSLIGEAIEVEYEDNLYAPCELMEVIIPIEHDEMETDLVYVAIKIDGKWFLTAELGI